MDKHNKILIILITCLFIILILSIIIINLNINLTPKVTGFSIDQDLLNDCEKSNLSIEKAELIMDLGSIKM